MTTNPVSPIYRDAGWLRQKYLGEGLSTRQIGRLVGVDKSVINKWLKKSGIHLRTVLETRGARAAGQSCLKKEWWDKNRSRFGGPNSPWRGKKVLSKETRELLSLARKKWWSEHPNYHPSEETRKKISIAKLGPRNPNWVGGATRAFFRKQFEDHYGIGISRGILLHHRDGNKHNNDMNNLVLVSRSAHRHIHENMINPRPEEGVLCLPCI